MASARYALQRTIFHIDMDAFFASVEQRDFPQYRGKPVIVGAAVGSRGVVSAASYEARRSGVHSAQPISEAHRRCPGGIFVRPRMDVYENVSASIMDLFARYSPAIEQISVDEAFLDMTGTERLLGPPLTAAATISAAIKSSVNLSASIGIAPNKFCAKIASDLNKPAGITLCPFEPRAIIEWLAPMPVRRIWGVGKQTAATLSTMGITTVGDLQQCPAYLLERRFGKTGSALYNLARGIDHRPVSSSDGSKSISREHTFPSDSSDRAEWQTTLYTLTQDVAKRARAGGVKGSTVFITWRRPDFTRHNRQKTLHPPTNVAKFIFEEAFGLLKEIREPALRLLGIGISGLDEPLQTDLFESADKRVQWEESEKAVDSLTSRFGTAVIKKGRELHGRHEKQDSCTD